MSAWQGAAFLDAETYSKSSSNAIYVGLMLVGYARASKNEQEASTQLEALQAADCEMIFRGKASCGRWDRPELHRLLRHLRRGDVVVVWKFDRLSPSLKDVLNIMARVPKANAGFRSLTEAIDTTTPSGRMTMQMAGSFAEFEREMPVSGPKSDQPRPGCSASILQLFRGCRIAWGHMREITEAQDFQDQ